MLFLKVITYLTLILWQILSHKWILCLPGPWSEWWTRITFSFWPSDFPLTPCCLTAVFLSSSPFFPLTDCTPKISLYLVNSAVNRLELPSLEFTLLIRVPEFHNQMTNDFDFREFPLCVNYWLFPFWILDSCFYPWHRNRTWPTF